MSIIEGSHPLHAYLDDACNLLQVLREDQQVLEGLKARSFEQEHEHEHENEHEHEHRDCEEGTTALSTSRRTQRRILNLIDGFGRLLDNVAGDDVDVDRDSCGSHGGRPSSSASAQSSLPSPPRSPSCPPLVTKSVLIVGASASGLGIAKALLTCDPYLDVILIESSDKCGASFRAWPKFTRFISPSFYSNPFGQSDLNAISPLGDNGVQAFLSSSSRSTDASNTQHPTGHEYAEYLDKLANAPLRGDRSADNGRGSKISRLKDYILFETTVTKISEVGYGR